MAKVLVTRVKTVQRVDVRRHRIREFVHIAVLRFAPLAHPGVAVGLHETRRHWLPTGIDDFGVVRDLDVTLRADRHDFPILEQHNTAIDGSRVGDRANVSIENCLHATTTEGGRMSISVRNIGCRFPHV